MKIRITFEFDEECRRALSARMRYKHPASHPASREEMIQHIRMIVDAAWDWYVYEYREVEKQKGISK